MNKFIITSDSSCDLTDKQASKLNINCAYLSYTIENEIFYDDMNEKHIDEFYEKMREARVAVVTSDVRPYGNIILKKGVFNS